MFLNVNLNNHFVFLQKDFVENNLHYLTLVTSIVIIFFLKNSNQINLNKLLNLNEKKNN